MQTGEFHFFQGEIDRLADIENSSVDAVILSNILDNLYPDDAKFLVEEVARILKPGGKVLLKLNPYLTEAQIKEWNIRIIKDNLLDDGLILWNNTTDEWQGIFKSQFDIYQVEDVYYPEYEQ